MLARVGSYILAIWLCACAAAAQEQSVLADAVAAARAKDWENVDALRPDIDNDAARDVVDWMRLRGGQGDFAECRNFLARNGDWPGLPLLRRSCERDIPRGGAAEPVIAFFSGTLPQTGAGSLRLIEAYEEVGRTGEAAAEARRAWQTHVMSQSEHMAFAKRHGDKLRDLHTVRLDMLLWEGTERAARRMFNLVSEDWAKLALARIGLRKSEPGVDTLIAAVPKKLQEDAGLAFERFLWRARKGRVDSALDLLMERSLSAKDLGRPIAWANRRRSLARQLMRDGQPGLAYAVASQHFLDAGSAYADLEWLSGFLALRKLDAPAEALIHFTRFQAAVATPISLGRAGYWLGRAHEALGDDASAADAYAEGARFQSSFYGQLAAERAGLPRDPSMAGTEVFPDWTSAEFTQSSVFKAALQLYEAGVFSLAERFLVHLGESQDRTGLGQLTQVALDKNEPHIALMIAKQAARQGHELFEAYFPLAVPQGVYTELPAEFPLSIARRESEFDPVVVSGAGAMGLMQLMPGTAREMAGAVGEQYARNRLVEDPKYNARLGVAYLEELSGRFRFNPVLMAIGYNAGPSRARRWPEQFGDPRDPNVDVIDWIEGIPFRETRNYVMRVTESFAPYRARLAGKVDDRSLLELLKQ